MCALAERPRWAAGRPVATRLEVKSYGLTPRTSHEPLAVTNRVQGNLLPGGIQETNRANRSGKSFRPMPAIRGLGANVAINLGIWDVAAHRLGRQGLALNASLRV